MNVLKYDECKHLLRAAVAILDKFTERLFVFSEKSRYGFLVVAKRALGRSPLTEVL